MPVTTKVKTGLVVVLFGLCRRCGGAGQEKAAKEADRG